jgi:hypothetical protein
MPTSVPANHVAQSDLRPTILGQFLSLRFGEVPPVYVVGRVRYSFEFEDSRPSIDNSQTIGYKYII